ncbi:SDR family oxidoreductase [Novosphingobium lubricantis]|uniref:SDR family NAD(P)-dependent oxidoreductase n=1 Tax=Novosphingobium sp. CCH12-A3 TaxID=1768752 RepID=UPI0007838634|nr:SDR family oxidoreductase [Novosphingobium sp. CCH12-A3]
MRDQAIVVGAGGALGQAIVTDLVAAGIDVLGVARNPASLAALGERHGDRFRAVIADMADDTAIKAIGAAITAPVSIVVHAPGVPVAGGVRAAPISALVEACNIKVGGFVRLVRAAEPHLRRGSRLVAIGGHYGFEPTAYAATAGVANAALANLVRQMSWAYGELGVTAHLVAPGPADTERLHGIARARAEKEGVSFDTMLDRMRADSAIGAFTSVESVAWAIALLLDPRADAFAGSTLMLDAGRRHAIP